MVNTISMQDMRYLNLFRKITQISTRFSFKYNDFIMFSVPKKLVSKAIGENGKNSKKIYEILGKRIKIIPSPNGIEDSKKFIESIISPVTFKNIEITSSEIIITAGPQNKAALIGRNKRRLNELRLIVKNFFNRDLRII